MPPISVNRTNNGPSKVLGYPLRKQGFIEFKISALDQCTISLHFSEPARRKMHAFGGAACVDAVGDFVVTSNATLLLWALALVVLASHRFKIP